MVEYSSDNTGIFIIIMFAFLAAAVQLLLCKKAKTISAKLIPVLGSAAFTVFFYVLARCVDDTTGGAGSLIILSYAIFAFILLVGCGIGWGIWIFIRKKH